MRAEDYDAAREDFAAVEAYLGRSSPAIASRSRLPMPQRGTSGTLTGVVSDEVRQQYREAYEQWQRHLERVHGLLLDGERMSPDRIKGLLNREARAKERYDAARRRLLGID